MNKLIALFFSLLIVGFVCLSQAQVPMTGAGLGKPAGGGVAYVGPGDTVASAGTWWGFRCYTAAYAGNVALIESPSDAVSTTISCNGAGALSYSGTAIGTTCAVSCTVKTLYDQSGASSCSGACDVTQATEASRPSFTNSCQNSRPCMVSSGVKVLTSANAGANQAQPVTASSVSKWDGTGVSVITNGATGGSTVVPYYDSGTKLNMYAGTVLAATISTNTLYASQAIFNGASCVNYINGASTNGNCGVNSLIVGTPYKVGANTSGGGNITFYEGGWWFSGFNGTQQSNMNTNQHDSTNGWNF